MNLIFQTSPEEIPLNFKIVSCLKVQPEELRCAEVLGETKGSIGTDGSLALDDLVDASSRYTRILCKAILRHTERTEKLFRENLTGMNWR